MNALDICVVGIIILSGVFAFARGFVRECLSIASWLGATAAALYLMSRAHSLLARFLPGGGIGDAVAAGIVFVVTLIVLTVVTARISRKVQHSSLSALDRTLGLVFGLGRGVILVAIMFFGMSFALPGGDRPEWLQQSRTAPIFADLAQDMSRYIPDSFRQHAAQLAGQTTFSGKVEDAIRAYTLPTPPAQSAGATHLSTQDQQRLNELFQRYGGNVQLDANGQPVRAQPQQAPPTGQ